MSKIYNQFAGKNLDRLTALSDGVFAFAMTLLVLDLRPPTLIGAPTETGMLGALHGLVSNFTTYLMSCLTLGLDALPPDSHPRPKNFNRIFISP